MNNGNKYFIHASEEPEESVGDGIERQMFGFGPSIMMTKAAFEQDSVGDIHSHEHAQVCYIASGEFDVSIDGEVRRMSAGDAFYAPPNVPHGAVCKRAGVLIDVFSPMREDFLSTENKS